MGRGLIFVQISFPFTSLAVTAALFNGTLIRLSYGIKNKVLLGNNNHSMRMMASNLIT